MNANAKRIAAKLLREAAETYSNHGSNDYDLLNTDLNWEFAVNSMTARGWDEGDVLIYAGGTMICTIDYHLMEHAATLLEQEADAMDKGV